MKNLKIKIFSYLWNFFSYIGYFKFHLFVSYLFISEFKTNRRKALFFKKKNPKKIKNILVLDALRFRGDLEIFSDEEENICFWTISWSFLDHMMKSFIIDNDSSKYQNQAIGFRSRFRMEKENSDIHVQRKKYREFLRLFLPILFKFYDFKMILNSDHRYRREADICRVSSELGFTHICYYREALYITKSNYFLAVKRHAEFGKFYGKAVLVQNEITKKMFVESGMLNENQIFIRGCPRMDNYISKIKKNKKPKRKNFIQISYFSCPTRDKTSNLKRIDLFKYSLNTIITIAEFCDNNRNIKFIIKFKDMHLSQLPIIKQKLKNKFNNNIPTNIFFETGRMAAQEIILSSDIVVSMQSTIVLEAAISGVNVILPHFKDLREQDGSKDVLMYQEYRDLFDVPEDYNDLVKIIEDRIKTKKIDKNKLKKTRQLFEKYVSPLNENATITSLNLIKRFLKNDN